ncbi:hypothetical protein [Chitinimonas naiadis]
MLAVAKALRPQPANCEDGARWLGEQFGLSAKAAQKLAGRAFVTQCQPKPAEKPAAVIAEPVLSAKPQESAPPALSIDEQYNQRVAAECARGLFGVVCRDKVKNELCKGRMSEKPGPGESRCKQALQQDTRDH